MINNKGYYYLATMFSKHPDGLAAAARESCVYAAQFIRAGVSVFSPIAHSYEISLWGAIDPLDLDIWLPLDEPFMHSARGLLVVTSLGWNDSEGIAHEIRVFAEAGKKIVLWAPGTAIPEGLI